MAWLIIHIMLLMVAVFLLGCLLGCILRRLFSPVAEDTAIGENLAVPAASPTSAATAPAGSLRWSITHQPGVVTLSGFAPSDNVRGRLQALVQSAFPGEKFASDMRVQPTQIPESDWLATTQFALSRVKQLKEGVAHGNDLSFDLDGALPEGVDKPTFLRDAFSALPRVATLASWSLRPSGVKGSFWSAALNDNTVTLSGSVPTREAREWILKDARMSFGTSEVHDRMRLDADMPRAHRWTQEAAFALTQLKSTSRGSVWLGSQGYGLHGVALDLPSYDRIRTAAGSLRPEGVDLHGLWLAKPGQELGEALRVEPVLSAAQQLAAAKTDTKKVTSRAESKAATVKPVASEKTVAVAKTVAPEKASTSSKKVADAPATTVAAPAKTSSTKTATPVQTTLAFANAIEPHPGKQPAGLKEPRGGKADNLKRISGIGRVNEKKLNELGIFHFDQIASWSHQECEWVNSFLAFPGRIEREDWVNQSKKLAAGEDTDFAKRVDKGEVSSSS